MRVLSGTGTGKKTDGPPLFRPKTQVFGCQDGPGAISGPLWKSGSPSAGLAAGRVWCPPGPPSVSFKSVGLLLGHAIQCPRCPFHPLCLPPSGPLSWRGGGPPREPPNLSIPTGRPLTGTHCLSFPSSISPPAQVQSPPPLYPPLPRPVGYPLLLNRFILFEHNFSLFSRSQPPSPFFPPHPPTHALLQRQVNQKLRFYHAHYGARLLTPFLRVTFKANNTKTHSFVSIDIHLRRTKQSITQIKATFPTHIYNGSSYISPPPRSHRRLCPPFCPRPLPQQAAPEPGARRRRHHHRHH